MKLFIDLAEEAQFTKSKFGRAMLLDSEGYTYTRQRCVNEKVYWRCIYHYPSRGKCPGRAKTEGFLIVSKSGGHIHKPHEPVVEPKPHGNLKSQK